MAIDLAINYRLAPQYPFPCALQDALAACRHSRMIAPRSPLITF